MGKPAPQGLEQAVQGDRRVALEAIRDRLAAELAREDVFGVAGIAKELRAVIAELDSLPLAKGSKSDDLAARRAARRRSTSAV